MDMKDSLPCKMCGMCCRTAISFMDKHKMDADLMKFYEFRKAEIVDQGDKYRIIMETVPCTHLTKDNKCALHGTDKKPKWCSEGPYWRDQMPLSCSLNKPGATRDPVSGEWYVNK